MSGSCNLWSLKKFTSAEVETEFRTLSEFLAAQVSENQSVSVEREHKRLTKNGAKLDITIIIIISDCY